MRKRVESRESTGDLRESLVLPTTLSNLLSCRSAASGEGGIRTPGTISGTQHFQCCTIGRSATSPDVGNLHLLRFEKIALEQRISSKIQRAEGEIDRRRASSTSDTSLNGRFRPGACGSLQHLRAGANRRAKGVSALVAESGFGDLAAPVVRLGGAAR